MLYIGVDLGTSAVKLLLMDGSGRIRKVVSREYPLYFPHPGRSEQNPEGRFTTSIDGMRELTSERDKSQVAGISFGGQMHDLVMLNKAGEVVRPTVLQNDGRSEKEADYLDQNIDKNKLPAYTTNIAFTDFTAPKILRMKKNKPEDFARICRTVLPKDHLAYRLSGSFYTGYSNASGMLLLDVARRHWSEEVMEMCGITGKQLPDLYESYQVVGNLKEELVKELGFIQDVEIIAGAGNNAAAAVGAGTVRKSYCNISLGTSGIVFISSESFKVDCNNAFHSFDHTDGHFHFTEYILSAASCNEWRMKEIPKTKEFSREQEGIVRLGEGHMFYPPYLIGERSPHNDPRARTCLIGMTMDISREGMTQAVLEDVVFGLRDSLGVTRSLGIRIDHTKIHGRGAKSPLWKRTVASIMNVKVDMVENEESPALGGVMPAAVGYGEYPDVKAAADSIVKIIETTGPDADLAERYEKQYGRFGQIYPALKTIFRNLGE